MKTFKEFLNEGKEEAAAIRDILKKELGLTARDVSVTSKYGGTSSAVTVKIKNTKALENYTKIENIGNSKQSYETDRRTGEILGGGNTFIFVSLDYKFEQELSKKVQDEFEKQTKGEWDEQDSAVLFGVFQIVNSGGTTSLSLKNGKGRQEVRSLAHIGGELMFLIKKSGDDSLYSKIK